MEIAIIILLIIANGIFAMAEIAIVSARKVKLQREADEGNKRARAALELSKNPSRFLSTVQVGITLIGIFTGAFGGATLATTLNRYLETIPGLKFYSNALSLALVVLPITYLSLIFGELAPKRLALSHPELIAKVVARPMNLLSTAFSPVITLLSISTDWILNLFHTPHPQDGQITQEEIRMFIREGAKAGLFEKTEREIMERTLHLGDKRISTLMTPRNEIVWLDIKSDLKTLQKRVSKEDFSYYPVCSKTIDRVIGIINTEEVLAYYLLEERIDLEKFLRKPLYVPNSTHALKVLELFRQSGIHMALIIDEYGDMEGLVTIDDILEAIVGHIPVLGQAEEKNIVKRENNTFFVEGLTSIDEFKEFFHLKKLASDKTGAFHTVGGFVMHKLGRVPETGDKVVVGNLQFEVADMDGNRVDKILITPVS